tara:strand:- start:200 stop:403 length:204 start_codon:yes stop_codon:yes gene_type:complete
MKKVLIGSTFALFAIVALSSCKKEYSCDCTDMTTLVTTTEMHKGKDATDACNDATSILPPVACVPTP